MTERLLRCFQTVFETGRMLEDGQKQTEFVNISKTAPNVKRVCLFVISAVHFALYLTGLSSMMLI